MIEDLKIDDRPAAAKKSHLVVMASPAFKHKINPYPTLLNQALQRQGVTILECTPRGLLFDSYDVLHFHWPEGHFLDGHSWSTLLRSIRFFLALMVVRCKSARIVWTAHNVQSHEHLHPQLEKICWWVFYRNLDGIISLNRAIKEQLEQDGLKGLKVPAVVIPHGHYRGVYPDEVSRSKARQHLGITKDKNLVFGWVGQIKPYKGLLELVEVWRDWPESDASLLIAGESQDTELDQRLQEAASRDKRLHHHRGWLENDQIQYFLKAADVFILPYLAISNSGSALLGLSFNLPLVMPHTPALEELQKSVGREWVYLYQGPLTVSVLADVRKWIENESRSTCAPLDFLDWNRLAEQTQSFYRKILP